MKAHSEISARRSLSGTIMPLIAVCVGVLLVVAVVGWQLCMMFGNSQGVRNAADASALNIATHAVDIKTVLGGGDEGQFQDCLDSSGQIGLANINRVVGKAMLMNANAQQMTQTGQTGQGQSHATSVAQAANAIEQRVAAGLSDQRAMQEFAAPMMPPEAHGGASGGDALNTAPPTRGVYNINSRAPKITVSFVHKGDQSNLSFTKQQFPQGTAPKINSPFLPGYSPITINNQQFTLVPFRGNEMPHLITLEEFGSNVQAFGSAVPNSFGITGSIMANGVEEIASASAVGNPQQQYTLAIANAFLSITFENNQANWSVQGKQIKQTTYGFAPETQWGVQKYPVGCNPAIKNCLLNGYASLGNEYATPLSIYSALTALPGNHQPLFAAMLQRLQEIDSTLTLKQLMQLLTSTPFQQGQQEYLIYPAYKTADATSPQLQIAPVGQIKSSWLNPAAVPDGTSQTIVQETSQPNQPNYDWMQIIGKYSCPQLHQVTTNGNLSWTPGSGYGQCLGSVTVQRTASVTFLGNSPN